MPRRPEFIFVMEDAVAQAPVASSPYRALGPHHGMLVFQRNDLPPVPVE